MKTPLWWSERRAISFGSSLYSSRDNFATGLTIVISLASANGGQAQDILKSPNCITWQPFLSISRKQSDLSRLSSTKSRTSCCKDSSLSVSHFPSSEPSTSDSRKSPIPPALVLGGQSAFKNRV